MFPAVHRTTVSVFFKCKLQTDNVTVVVWQRLANNIRIGV